MDKKIYNNSVSGSAQAIVPVKPVCPNEDNETSLHVGPPLIGSGLSKPKPLLLLLSKNELLWIDQL